MGQTRKHVCTGDVAVTYKPLFCFFFWFEDLALHKYFRTITLYCSHLFLQHIVNLESMTVGVIVLLHLWCHLIDRLSFLWRSFIVFVFFIFILLVQWVSFGSVCGFCYLKHRSSGFQSGSPHGSTAALWVAKAESVSVWARHNKTYGHSHVHVKYHHWFKRGFASRGTRFYHKRLDGLKPSKLIFWERGGWS